MNTTLVPLYIINGLLMIAMPIALGLYLRKKFSVGWRFFWVGALTFVLSQIGHIPFNTLVSMALRPYLPTAPAVSLQWLVYAVLLGLSAGVWEECFRYIAYRWIVKDARSWGSGLMLGAGHGGIEAIIFGLLALYSLVQIIALSNISDLSAILPPAQVEATRTAIQQYWSAPFYMTLMGAIERVFAILFHLTASVMVLQVFLGRGRRWLLAAIGWHTVLDLVAVWLMAYKNPLLIEAGMLVISLFSIAILYYLSRTTPPAPEVPALATEPLSPAPLEALAGVEELEDEDLEKSKFQ